MSKRRHALRVLFRMKADHEHLSKATATAQRILGYTLSAAGGPTEKRNVPERFFHRPEVLA